MDGFSSGGLASLAASTVGSGSGSSALVYEFGYYIQSRRFGPLWLPVFGLPSILHAWLGSGYSTLQEYENSFYTEKNAGVLGRKYW